MSNFTRAQRLKNNVEKFITGSIYTTQTIFEDTQKFIKSNIPNRQKIKTTTEATESRLYHEIVEKGNDGILIIHRGVVKFANEKVERMLGYKSIELSGMNYSSIIDTKDREKAINYHKRRLIGQEVPNRYEISLLNKSKRKIPVEVSASVIKFRGYNASLIILRDIRDRKKIQEKLEIESEKLNAIYKHIQEGMASYDKYGRVLYMNPALHKLFGVKRNLIGVKRSSIRKKRSNYFKYKLDRFDNSADTERKVYSGRKVTNVLMLVHSKPPKYLEADYVPLKNSSGDVVGMSASFRDVTLLKKQAERIENQLLESESQKERIQAIFENVEEAVFILDKNLNIIEANSSAQIMAGSVGTKLIGRKYNKLFDCHDRFGHRYPEFDPVSKLLISKESVPYDEHIHTSSEGEERWVGSSYSPVFDKNREIKQIVAVSRDITSIKELEKAKSEFVSLASHELRTPLTVINGYLSLLLSGDLGSLERKASREQFTTILHKVQSETQRLTKLVGELLNVSRIEEGRIRLNMKKIDPVEILADVSEDMKAISAIKGVRLSVENGLTIERDKREIFADEIRFKEILVNLLENAVKFTHSGGKISAKVNVKNKKVYIEVKDTGVGISDNLLPRVFDKFQQEPGSFLKENKGHGLGLFIVKSLVNLHGGDIFVSSKKGRGSTFTVQIPVAGN